MHKQGSAGRVARVVSTLASTLVLVMLSGVAHATPITLELHGKLQGGGSFDGWIMYSDHDIDGRSDYGRYEGGLWDLRVTGAGGVVDGWFSNTLPGRALIEAAVSPFPAIGIVFLFPGPLEIPSFDAYFAPLPGYDPDGQPLLSDFGNLIIGSVKPPTFGVYRDGAGHTELVVSANVSSPVPEPGTLALLAIGLPWVVYRRFRSGAPSR